MKKTYRLDDISDLSSVVRQIRADFADQRVFLLYGGLGAGKTTLVQGMCRLLDVTDEVVSPTYTIINEYKTRDGELVYHADLYRIESLQDAMETGIEDCLYGGNPCFVEWPEIIAPLLPAKFVKLEISMRGSVASDIKEGNENGRIITAKLHG